MSKLAKTFDVLNQIDSYLNKIIGVPPSVLNHKDIYMLCILLKEYLDLDQSFSIEMNNREIHSFHNNQIVDIPYTYIDLLLSDFSKVKNIDIPIRIPKGVIIYQGNFTLQ